MDVTTSTRMIHRTLCLDSNGSSSSDSRSVSPQIITKQSTMAIPPTHSRLPPDGHEFPPDYKEPITNKSLQLPLVRKLSGSSTGSLENKGSTFDIKSQYHPDLKNISSVPKRPERHSINSVRDKIALFSNHKLQHHQSSEDVARIPPPQRILIRSYTSNDVRFGSSNTLTRVTSRQTDKIIGMKPSSIGIIKSPPASDKKFSTSEPTTKVSPIHSKSRNLEKSSAKEESQDPRVLRKNSIEAINRRNVLDSCKKSNGGGGNENAILFNQQDPKITSIPEFRPLGDLESSVSLRNSDIKTVKRKSDLAATRNSLTCLGKPATRSSSFTIAERRKSFEMLSKAQQSEQIIKMKHSSQSSLTTLRKNQTSCLDSNKLLLEKLSKSKQEYSMESSETCEKNSRNENHSISTSSSSAFVPFDSLSKKVQNKMETSKSETHETVSRRSSRSEADGGSRVSTPTKPPSPPVVSNGSSPKRSTLATPCNNSANLLNNSVPNEEFSNSTPKNISPKYNFESNKESRPTSLATSEISKTLTTTKETKYEKLQEQFKKTPSFASIKNRQKAFETSESCSSTIVTTGDMEETNTIKRRKATTSKIVTNQNITTTTINKPSLLMNEDNSKNLTDAFQNISPIKKLARKDKEDMMDRGDCQIKSRAIQDLEDSPFFQVGEDTYWPEGSTEWESLDAEIASKFSQRPSNFERIGDNIEQNKDIIRPKVFESLSSVKSSTQQNEMSSISKGSSSTTISTVSSSAELIEVFSRNQTTAWDIQRAFQKAEESLSTHCPKSPKICSSPSSNGLSSVPSHHRMSSLDSTASDESGMHTPHYCGSVSSLQSSVKDHYGSFTSIASSTSLISPQELQGLIDEANQSLEVSGTPSHEIMVIVLHREFASRSIGITLAGGADYENKDITVHKVIPGTLADRDGRIQKGDRVLSINGRSTTGVTHREALSILKTPRAEVVLVLSRARSVTPADLGSSCTDGGGVVSYLNKATSGRPPKILESPLDSKSLLSDLKFVDVPRGPPLTVILKKEGTGLGFSLEGGKDSPLGDRPLTIKKIFKGGAADKTGLLKVGDEILSVNNTDCTRMSRIEAWNFMKKLSDGTANLIVRQKIEDDKPKVSTTTENTTASSLENPNPSTKNQTSETLTVQKMEQGTSSQAKHI